MTRRVTRRAALSSSLGFGLSLGLGLVSAGCKRQTSTAAGPLVLDGAGATLPFPLYARWASDYAKLEPGVRINYQPLGSGAGLRQMTDGVIDFGAIDEPMGDAELTKRSLVPIPMTIGAVVLAYNAPDLDELKLSAEVIADIFLGRITRWDDPRIAQLNEGTKLPSGEIVVVHRADGSGTSAALTAFLSRYSADFANSIGSATTPRFPVGIGARGNEGVTATIAKTPLAFGYVERAYARHAKLSIARVRNKRGELVAPSQGSLELAARSAVKASPEDARMSVVDSDMPGAYPIAALSAVVVRRESNDRNRGTALAKFLWWGLHDGQRVAAALDYAPLPTELVERGERALRDLRGGGQPLLASEAVQ